MVHGLSLHDSSGGAALRAAQPPVELPLCHLRQPAMQRVASNVGYDYGRPLLAAPSPIWRPKMPFY